jgi:putative glutamine amidotransferase
MGRRVLVSAATVARAAPYVEALTAASLPAASVLVVTPGAGADADELAAGAAALVLCGGSDVDPRRYGEEPLPGAGVEVAPERDALEWELLAAARERRLPVWGICRGFQVLNVFLGGSLWQDLPLQLPGDVVHDPEAPPERLTHSLRVLAPEAPLGERLAAAGPAPLVNSRHHQGVKRLAAGLVAVAAAPDGLIEAAVLGNGTAWSAGAAGPPMTAGTAGATGKAGSSGAAALSGTPPLPAWWVRGVEWHPENLLALPEQLALWQDFAAAVRAAEGVP